MSNAARKTAPAILTDQIVTPDTFRLAETPVVFDYSGALWLPESGTLVFADLHFEKGSSYARRGLFLPPYDTRRTLNDMADAIRRYSPEKVISLGDAFHDKAAEARMSDEDAAALEVLTTGCDWLWILGNHDPLPPARFSGHVAEQIWQDGLLFSHEPHADAPWQVVGHMHPVAKIVGRGRNIRRRCFITDGQRLIMPSFGAYTGGLNVLDPAYAPLFQSTFSVHLLGKNKVWQAPRSALGPDC